MKCTCGIAFCEVDYSGGRDWINDHATRSTLGTLLVPHGRYAAADDALREEIDLLLLSPFRHPPMADEAYAEAEESTR